MTEIANHRRVGSHRSGKLVVIAIFAFGLVLGAVALAYRKSMPTPTPNPPATQRVK